MVEDNRANRAIVAAVLQALDFEISFAVDGKEALEKIQETQFDIVLMDIQMPVMDGLEATRKIRDLGGWCASVPIIAVTANEMVRDDDAFDTAGLDGVVPKPLNTRELADTILRHMAKNDD